MNAVLRAVALLALISACSLPVDPECLPAATRAGWQETFVSATCDTAVAGITPPPPGGPSGNAEDNP